VLFVTEAALIREVQLLFCFKSSK